MRVKVDQDAVHLELSDSAVAKSHAVTEGVVVDYDDAGRMVRVVVRTGDPAVLGSVDWPGYTAATARPAVSVGPPVEAAPKAYDGALSWEPEAEAAMNGVPFFQRGPTRLAAAALARKRGSATVTAALVSDARRGAR